jgi:hypothetical protein
MTFRYGPWVYTNYIWYLRMSLWIRHTTDPATLSNEMPAGIAWLWITLWLLLMTGAAWRRNVVALLWFTAAIVPMTSLSWGAAARELYVAGPPLAILLGSVVVTVFDAAARVRPTQIALAAGAVVLAVVLLVFTRDQIQLRADYPAEEHAFLEDLRRANLGLARGDSLYVVDPPLSLAILGGVNLGEAVQIYFPDVDVHVVSIGEARTAAATGDPRVKLFRWIYRR